MLFFILIAVARALTDSNCYQIVCGAGITSDNCISVTGSTVTLTGCRAGLYCNYLSLRQLGNWTNVKCEPFYNTADPCFAPKDSVAVGLPCCQNSNCLSGSCDETLFICLGKNSNDKCSGEEDCSPDLYCNQGNCEKLKSDGKNCTSDLECKIGSCCSNNVCVQILSLPSGNVSTNAKACISNFVRNNICETIRPDTRSSNYQCNIGETCNYRYDSDGSLFRTETCLCGGTNSTKGYCSRYLEYSIMATLMLKELQYSTSNCLGHNAHSTDPEVLYLCGSITPSTYLQYHRYLGQLLYYNIYSDSTLEFCSMALSLFDSNFTFVPSDSGSVLVFLVLNFFF